MQKCSTCSVMKPLSDFHRDKNKRFGVATTCKDCAKERARRWFSDNRERGLATRKAWHEQNRDHILAKMKEYRLKNYDACQAASLRWRANNREQKLERDRIWQSANPEKVRQYRRVSEARRRAVEGFHTTEDLAIIRKQQRGKCAICRGRLGDDDHTDHIQPISRGGTSWPNNIQLLCGPCNRKKHAHDPIDHMRSLGFLL